MSKLFSQTLREIPSEAEIASHKLLLRAGFIRQHAAGIFSYMPLARRSLAKIERILREEMDRIGGQEITMPVVHPAKLWQDTGRWFKYGDELGRFKDRTGRDMVLAMTHEEVTTDLVRKEIHSYRQLPLLVYHIQTKWRDDPRPRGGLIRVREFTMKDSYSLDADWEGLEVQYRAHYQAYFNIFNRCGLKAVAVKSDAKLMGGKLAHEFMYLSPIGEDTIILCDACGYAANRQIAQFGKKLTKHEKPLPLKKVATPGCKTIAELAEFLDIPQSRTAKAVFMIATIPNLLTLTEGETQHGLAGNSMDTKNEVFVFAIVRGDMDVNETKLANTLHADSLRPATEAEIRSTGAEPGYASPVGLEGVLVVVDDIIPESTNLVAGANETGFHLLNVNHGRDYQSHIISDITAAQDGDACPDCGEPMRAERGVEIGNIFQLGTKYSEDLDARYQDRDGVSHPVVMGSYGIGTGRLLACIAEEYNDENGLVWPVSVAPFHVHLIVLVGKSKGKKKGEVKGRGDVLDESLAGQSSEAVAESLYEELIEAGIEVLYDDRQESPGVKFKDADLIGVPTRVTVSQRALDQGGVEFKRRDQPEKRIVPINDLRSTIVSELAILQSTIDSTVQSIEYVG